MITVKVANEAVTLARKVEEGLTGAQKEILRTEIFTDIEHLPSIEEFKRRVEKAQNSHEKEVWETFLNADAVSCYSKAWKLCIESFQNDIYPLKKTPEKLPQALKNALDRRNIKNASYDDPLKFSLQRYLYVFSYYKNPLITYVRNIIVEEVNEIFNIVNGSSTSKNVPGEDAMITENDDEKKKEYDKNNTMLSAQNATSSSSVTTELDFVEALFSGTLPTKEEFTKEVEVYKKSNFKVSKNLTELEVQYPQVYVIVNELPRFAAIYEDTIKKGGSPKAYREYLSRFFARLENRLQNTSYKDVVLDSVQEHTKAARKFLDVYSFTSNIKELLLDEQKIYQVLITCILSTPPFLESTFVDYYDTEVQAAQSPLLTSVKNGITPEEFAAQFKDYELED